MKYMDLGDHIGMESYVEMKSDLDIDLLCCGGDGGNRRLPARREKTEREFPPPLPCISMTENLKRYYTGDGRLIIREEKANYLRARRSNGRLTLELVSTNDDVLDRSDGVFEEEEEREGNVDVECEKCESVNDVVSDEKVESESNFDDCEINGGDVSSHVDREEAIPVDRTAVIGGAKCYRYNSWGVFDIGAPAIRPVHI